MTTYSVIIGSPPRGPTLQSRALGSLGCLTKDSTPAERLNVAFRFGKVARVSKSGCIKARHSISAMSPASGEMRISRSWSCSRNVVRHVRAFTDMFLEVDDEQRQNRPLAHGAVSVSESGWLAGALVRSGSGRDVPVGV